MGEVAIIGLDGLSWDILLGYVGFLPNIQRLLSGSILGSLVCKPPVTPPSWTSIFTGVRPEKHGILGFAKYSKRSSKLTHRFYNAADVAVPRISEIFAFHDLSSVLVNHILSYPSSAWYRKNHVIVYDVLSPKEFIYPRIFQKYLRYFKYPGEMVTQKAGRSDILEKWSKLIQLRVDGTVKLVEQVSPDLLIEVISETDSAMHRVPPIAAGKFIDGYLRILEPIDDLVNYAMKHFNTVFLVSDHGLRLIPKSINLQLLLKAVNSSKNTITSSFKGVIASLILTSRISELVGYSLLASMKTYPLFYKVRGLLRKKIETNTNHGLENSGVCFDPVDASDAMLLYFKDLKTRERVYELAVDVLGDLLEEVKKIDASNVPVLMVIPKHGYYLNMDAIHRAHNAKIINFPSARHTTLGIFALWRKGYNISKYIGLVHNVDVVPTILSHLRLPLPSYADGKSVINKRVEYIDYRRRWLVSRKVNLFRSKLARAY